MDRVGRQPALPRARARARARRPSRSSPAGPSSPRSRASPGACGRRASGSPPGSRRAARRAGRRHPARRAAGRRASRRRARRRARRSSRQVAARVRRGERIRRASSLAVTGRRPALIASILPSPSGVGRSTPATLKRGVPSGTRASPTAIAIAEPTKPRPWTQTTGRSTTGASCPAARASSANGISSKPGSSACATLITTACPPAGARATGRWSARRTHGRPAPRSCAGTAAA